MRREIIDRINLLARENEPFLFVIDYNGTEAYIKKLAEINPNECLYNFEGSSNAKDSSTASATNPHLKVWKVKRPSYETYQKSFDIVKRNILAGNSYLTNLTCQAQVSCNLSLRDILRQTKAKYKLLINSRDLQHGHFVCFSPETFVRIKNGRIYSYPMKGTIDAAIPDAQRVLLEDKKESAEHATIVDLIRNDLSSISTNVRIDRYRYIDVLHTNKGDILQTSSEISGLLPSDYPLHLGDILDAQLPAGSITGAPKNKTQEIIQEAETYERGFYTGIMGIYNKGELNSAVMIRFLEENENGLFFKAGGGITSKSDSKREYEEVIQKMYLPISYI